MIHSPLQHHRCAPLPPTPPHFAVEPQHTQVTIMLLFTAVVIAFVVLMLALQLRADSHLPILRQENNLMPELSLGSELKWHLFNSHICAHAAFGPARGPSGQLVHVYAIHPQRKCEHERVRHAGGARLVTAFRGAVTASLFGRDCGRGDGSGPSLADQTHPPHHASRFLDFPRRRRARTAPFLLLLARADLPLPKQRLCPRISSQAFSNILKHSQTFFASLLLLLPPLPRCQDLADIGLLEQYIEHTQCILFFLSKGCEQC